MEPLKAWPAPTPENVAAYQRSREREKLVKPGITVRFLMQPAGGGPARSGTIGIVKTVEDSFATVRVRFLRFFRVSVFAHASILEPVEQSQ